LDLAFFALWCFLVAFAGAIPEWLLLSVIAIVLIQSAIELLRNPPKPAGGDGGELDVRAAVLSGAMIGLLGSRLTGRLSEAALIKAIAVVLLIAAAGCIVQALT
jgi:hypothetical protein